jgi:hypothetical protein
MWAAPVYLALGVIVLCLVAGYGWPVASADEEVVFRDVVDHVWWGVPQGFIMATCYQFARDGEHDWVVQCGDWRLRYNDETGDVRPADEATQAAWDRALTRQNE